MAKRWAWACCGVVGLPATDRESRFCAPYEISANWCISPTSDVANCGACGVTCSADEVCDEGSCRLDCISGQMDCGGTCVDPWSPSKHCGSCGIACAAGRSRRYATRAAAPGRPNAAACAATCRLRKPCGGDVADGTVQRRRVLTSCTSTLTDCDGSCRDLYVDRTNCGACAFVCRRAGLLGVCRLGAVADADPATRVRHRRVRNGARPARSAQVAPAVCRVVARRPHLAATNASTP
ncbi:MAG: hypothetical protein H6708_19850 [Kofleriaceae bacterium]|nr:hypothetical protein [Kofleriaceae bacterium]